MSGRQEAPNARSARSVKSSLRQRGSRTLLATVVEPTSHAWLFLFHLSQFLSCSSRSPNDPSGQHSMKLSTITESPAAQRALAVLSREHPGPEQREQWVSAATAEELSPSAGALPGTSGSLSCQFLLLPPIQCSPALEWALKQTSANPGFRLPQAFPTVTSSPTSPCSPLTRLQQSALEDFMSTPLLLPLPHLTIPLLPRCPHPPHPSRSCHRSVPLFSAALRSPFQVWFRIVFLSSSAWGMPLASDVQ